MSEFTGVDIGPIDYLTPQVSFMQSFKEPILETN